MQINDSTSWWQYQSATDDTTVRPQRSWAPQESDGTEGVRRQPKPHGHKGGAPKTESSSDTNSLLSQLSTLLQAAQSTDGTSTQALSTDPQELLSLLQQLVGQLQGQSADGADESQDGDDEAEFPGFPPPQFAAPAADGSAPQPPRGFFKRSADGQGQGPRFDEEGADGAQGFGRHWGRHGGAHTAAADTDAAAT